MDSAKIKPELLICHRCRFWSQRFSHSKTVLVYDYCSIRLDGKKGKKRVIAMAGYGYTRYKGIPENCPFYLEHFMNKSAIRA